MYKTISNEIIRKFNPCYDPSKFIKDDNEELSVIQWVEKYRNVFPTNDILWLLLRKEFLSEKDLRLFAVWCTRKTLKLIKNPDKRSVEACDVAERYANGEAIMDELYAAYIAADNVVDAAKNATCAAYAAANDDYIAYYDAIVVANAADAAARVAYYADLANSDTVFLAAIDAAYVAYYAARAANDTVSAADAAYAATSSVQLDKLLTYFE
jgi:predicted nucleic acid-binding protein